MRALLGWTSIKAGVPNPIVNLRFDVEGRPRQPKSALTRDELQRLVAAAEDESEDIRAMIILGNGDVLACASPASRIGSLSGSTIAEIWNSEAFQELRRRANSERPPLMCYHCFAYRKPGNADGVFMHHLVDGYDLPRDLADDGYAEAFRRRFSFAEFNRSRRVNVGAR